MAAEATTTKKRELLHVEPFIMNNTTFAEMLDILAAACQDNVI